MGAAAVSPSVVSPSELPLSVVGEGHKEGDGRLNQDKIRQGKTRC